MIDPLKQALQELSAAKKSNDLALEEILRAKEELDVLAIQKYELP